MTAAEMTSIAAIRTFVTSGKAVFTLVSKKTGSRLTFRVRTSDRINLWFVDVLSGPENTSDYTFLGTIWERSQNGMMSFRRSPKSRMSHDAVSVMTANWFTQRLNVDDAYWDNSTCEFWHSGKCGRCGRLLTDPDSIATGLGPVCAEKAHA